MAFDESTDTSGNHELTLLSGDWETMSFTDGIPCAMCGRIIEVKANIVGIHWSLCYICHQSGITVHIRESGDTEYRSRFGAIIVPQPNMIDCYSTSH